MGWGDAHMTNMLGKDIENHIFDLLECNREWLFICEYGSHHKVLSSGTTFMRDKADVLVETIEETPCIPNIRL
jgi:hypothetical protein